MVILVPLQAARRPLDTIIAFCVFFVAIHNVGCALLHKIKARLKTPVRTSELDVSHASKQACVFSESTVRIQKKQSQPHALSYKPWTHGPLPHNNLFPPGRARGWGGDFTPRPQVSSVCVIPLLPAAKQTRHRRIFCALPPRTKTSYTRHSSIVFSAQTQPIPGLEKKMRSKLVYVLAACIRKHAYQVHFLSFIKNHSLR